MSRVRIPRIALLSSTRFGRRCLEEAILPTRDAALVGILTTPRDIRVSYAKQPVSLSTHATFSDLAAAVGCPLATLEGPATTDAYTRAMQGWDPDLLLVLGWYYRVPAPVRAVAGCGCVGIHASLLPKYRGGAPLTWAMIQGESRTGVTLFELADAMDAGPVIAQTACAIDANETCATLYDKAEQASVGLLRTWLPRLVRGDAPRVPQRDADATWFPQRSPEDGALDWTSRSARQAHDWIRAQTRPYPGAWTTWNGQRLMLWKASLVDTPATTAAPGTVLMPGPDATEMFQVVCSDGRPIYIHEAGLPDGAPLDGESLIRRWGMRTGAVLGESRRQAVRADG